MFFGTATTAAFIPGLVGVIVILVCDCIYIYSALKKAEKKDEHFTPGGNIRLEEGTGNEKLPNFFLSIIPLLIVAVMNMIFGVDVVLALMAGAVVAAVALCNFIVTPDAKLKPYMDMVGQGITAAVISGLATCGLTHKEGYGPIFRTTVLYIFFGMLAVILMCVLFPGLAAA